MFLKVFNMAYFLVLIKIDDLRYLKVYAIMLFSGKVYRFYSEGLEVLLNEIFSKSFVLLAHSILFCAPPSSS